MANTSPPSLKRMLFKNGHGLVLVDPEHVIFIEKQGKRCLIHTTHGRYSVSEPLCALEQRLPFPPFFRCHRSFIINTDKVERIRPYADRAYEVTFHRYTAKASMRRHKVDEFCRLLAGGLPEK